jgi:hypothetical protein
VHGAKIYGAGSVQKRKLARGGHAHIEELQEFLYIARWDTKFSASTGVLMGVLWDFDCALYACAEWADGWTQDLAERHDEYVLQLGLDLMMKTSLLKKQIRDT